VDRANNCLSLVTGQFVEQLADGPCLEGIKTRGWLVKKDHTGVGNEFNTDRATLTLASGKDFVLGISDHA